MPIMAVTTGLWWLGGVSWTSGGCLTVLVSSSSASFTSTASSVASVGRTCGGTGSASSVGALLSPEGSNLWLVLTIEGGLGFVQVDCCYLDLLRGLMHLVRSLENGFERVLGEFHVTYVGKHSHW